MSKYFTLSCRREDYGNLRDKKGAIFKKLKDSFGDSSLKNYANEDLYDFKYNPERETIGVFVKKNDLYVLVSQDSPVDDKVISNSLIKLLEEEIEEETLLKCRWVK